MVIFTKDIPADSRFKVGYLVLVSARSAWVVDDGTSPLAHVDVQPNVYGIRGIDFNLYSRVTILS